MNRHAYFRFGLRGLYHRSGAWRLERSAVWRSSAMEGTSTAGTPAVSAGATGPMSHLREAAADTGTANRCSEAELSAAVGDGERQTMPAVAPLSGRKRKPDAEDGESGSDGAQLVERLPMAAVLDPAVPVPPTPLPLRRLLNACQAVFNGSSTPPMPAVISWICGIMDAIGPEDVRLWDEVRFLNKMNTAGHQNPPIITCKPIYASRNFTIAASFCR
ncbi:hypothetical protein BS78_01G139500 [Paspalum vaginatum]|nr:hypothetical protein BS78_01G139500 [Paspalum vaginatum]